eukprot:tig00021038_g17524.t1
MPPNFAVDLASIFGAAPPPTVYAHPPEPAPSAKGDVLRQEVFRDLSSRAAVFREKIIEEFRLKDEILEENSENAPQYSSTEVVRDEKLMTKVLFEKPTQLVRFKIFKRSAADKDQKIDRRLIRVRNINTLPVGVWAGMVVDSTIFSRVVKCAIASHGRLINIKAAFRIRSIAILINCLTMGIQTELKDEDYMTARVLSIMDYMILILFAIEIFLKARHPAPRPSARARAASHQRPSSQWLDSFERFWQSGWNIFDFLVTFLSIIPEIIVAASGPSAPRGPRRRCAR